MNEKKKARKAWNKGLKKNLTKAMGKKGTSHSIKSMGVYNASYNQGKQSV